MAARSGRSTLGSGKLQEVEHFTAVSGFVPEGADGFSTFTIVDYGGTVRITRHDYVGKS